MFCRNCGNKLLDDAKFCNECGTAVKSNANAGIEVINKEESKQNVYSSKNKAPKSKLPTAMLVCVAAAVVLSGIMLFPKHSTETDSIGIQLPIVSYESVMEKAQTAIAEKNYETAIENLNIAIEKKPEISENYITLAQIYLDTQELYKANEIIKRGQIVTGSEEFDEVVLWGTIMDEEISLVIEEEFPFTKKEYHFTEDTVYSISKAFGMEVTRLQYSFDSSGSIEKIYYYTTLIDNSFCTGNPLIEYWDNPSLMPTYLGCITRDDIEEVNKNIIIEKDEDNRISSIVYETIGETMAEMIFTYYPEGWDVNMNSHDETMKFNNKGEFIGLESDGVDAIYMEWNDNGKVEKIYNNEGTLYEYHYNSEGNLVMARNYADGEFYYTIDAVLAYDSDGRVKEIEYYEGARVPEYRKKITYDDYGRVIQLERTMDAFSTLWIAKYQYDGDRLVSYTLEYPNGQDPAPKEYLIDYSEDGAYIGIH